MAEQVFPAAPISTAAGRVITSPFQFVTTGEDNLLVACANSVVGVRLSIQGRRLSPKGTVEAFAFSFTPSSDRLVTSSLFSLGVGAILNLTVFAAAGTPQIGQTFVQAKLVRGFSGALVVLGTLLQGYVTSSQELAWPGSPISNSMEGGGCVRTLIGTQPIAGLECIESVPTGARWELLCWTAAITTSGAGVNRNCRLATKTPSLYISFASNSLVAAPGSFTYHSWGQGLTADSPPSVIVGVGAVPITLMLTAGQVIRTDTENLLAADQWTAPVFAVREWLVVQ